MRSTDSVAPSGAGAPKSETGTTPVCPDPPKPLTTSPNASNASPSDELTSPTTESAPCYMQANPTGHYSTPSLPPEIRRATKASRARLWILVPNMPARVHLARLCSKGTAAAVAGARLRMKRLDRWLLLLRRGAAPRMSSPADAMSFRSWHVLLASRSCAVRGSRRNAPTDEISVQPLGF